MSKTKPATSLWTIQHVIPVLVAAGPPGYFSAECINIPFGRNVTCEAATAEIDDEELHNLWLERRPYNKISELFFPLNSDSPAAGGLLTEAPLLPAPRSPTQSPVAAVAGHGACESGHLGNGICVKASVAQSMAGVV